MAFGGEDSGCAMQKPAPMGAHQSEGPGVAAVFEL